MLRAAAALDAAGVPYAVIGGNAVAGWVSRIDEAAVRNTRGVDFLLRRGDLEAAKTALAKVGFLYRHVRSVDLFLDGPGAKARDAVHVVFANEKVQSDNLLPSPDVVESERSASFQLLNLEALVRMKLNSFRLKDQVHLQDMAELGLINSSWLARFPAALSERLRQILDNPQA